MENLIIETLYGKLKGYQDKDIDNNDFYSFKGIPYAKPPVGNLRFNDPLPPEPWSDTKDASKFGPNCCQFYLPTDSVIGSDDCLYLNVYTKNLNSTANLPVLFWVHGGAFSFGNGDDELYGPKYFLRKNVVLVTINYRVAVLGFLNLEDEAAPGNMGLKDQVMALKWVKENISHFGGDPDNITIFGESAGGASVHYLCFSETTKGLFQKAIIQSGAATNPWASIKNPKKYGFKLAEYLGCTEKNPKKVVEFLRTIECTKLLEAQEKIMTPEDRKMKFLGIFGPGVDDKSSNPFLPIPIETAINKGIHVPLIIGSNNREGILMLDGLQDKVFDTIKSEFDSFLNPNIKYITDKYNLKNEDLYRLYFENGKQNKSNKENYVDMASDLHFVHGIYEIINIQLSLNNVPTYVYSFTYDKGFSLLKLLLNTNLKGASHFDEINYLFNYTMFDLKYIIQNYSRVFKTFNWMFWNLKLWNPVNFISYLSKYKLSAKFTKGNDDYKLMEQMTELWYNFAKYGVPTSKYLTSSWKPIKKDMPQTLVIGLDGLRLENKLHLEEYFTLKKLIKN